MKHRMSAAKLIVSSYGDSFDPTTQKPPHTLAKNLDPGGVIQKLLDSYVHLWLSANGRSSEDALDDARAHIGTSLSTALGKTYEIMSDKSFYDIVYDDAGNPIGHDTAAWVYVNKAPLFKSIPQRPRINMYGCIFLGVIPE